ncbi:efflux RND transporter permease subunit [Winogradskyella maritima]|nr:efflux RND transporter permease subunit [Winogradskyella maritima]
MSNLPDVKEIRSVSRFGLSVVTVVFDDDMGTYLPRQLVSEKLTEVREQIPEGFGQPSIGQSQRGWAKSTSTRLKLKKDTKTTTRLPNCEQFRIGLSAGKWRWFRCCGSECIWWEQKTIRSGRRPRRVARHWHYHFRRLQTLESNNQNTGGAYIERNHQANFIRGEGLARSVSDIENMVVKTVEGIPIKIKDVGTVRIGSAVRYGALTKDGKGEAVGGMILMLKGANSNEVIENVTQRMEQIQQSLPKGVVIKPFLDRSELIAETTGTVTTNLLEGGLIVIFVLVLLLGNWRGGLIVASTIPLSLLFAFILMNVFDVWANLMSLGPSISVSSWTVR